jgi:Helix-turn-helix domain
MSTQTQNQQIIRYLKFGRKLTPLAALRLFGCFRLAARVHELRQNGLSVKTGTVHVNGKRFAEYHL